MHALLASAFVHHENCCMQCSGRNATIVPGPQVAKGMHTSESTFKATLGLCQRLGKTVCVSQDRPGFIMYRVMLGDAACLHGRIPRAPEAGSWTGCSAACRRLLLSVSLPQRGVPTSAFAT